MEQEYSNNSRDIICIMGQKGPQGPQGQRGNNGVEDVFITRSRSEPTSDTDNNTEFLNNAYSNLTLFLDVKCIRTTNKTVINTFTINIYNVLTTLQRSYTRQVIVPNNADNDIYLSIVESIPINTKLYIDRYALDQDGMTHDDSKITPAKIIGIYNLGTLYV